MSVSLAQHAIKSYGVRKFFKINRSLTPCLLTVLLRSLSGLGPTKGRKIDLKTHYRAYSDDFMLPISHFFLNFIKIIIIGLMLESGAQKSIDVFFTGQ